MRDVLVDRGDAVTEHPTLFADLAVGPVATLTPDGWISDSPIAIYPPWWGDRKAHYPHGPPYIRIVADVRTQVGDQLYVCGVLIATRVSERRADSERTEWWVYEHPHRPGWARRSGQVALRRSKWPVGAVVEVRR